MAAPGSALPDGTDATPLRVLIVDDEPLARRRMVAMLSEHPGIEIVGEGEDAASATALLAETRPDVMFLDVQMPEVDGFALLDGLDPLARPFVVFMTAYAQHAVRAFDAGAVDYLLKPYDQRRLSKSLDRARAAITATRPSREEASAELLLDQVRALVNKGRSSPEQSSALPESPGERTDGRYLERVAVTIGSRTVFVAISLIQWIEADRNYLRLHTRDRTYIIRSSVGAFETRLDPREFVRVHRSAIVRLDCVQELRTLAPGVWRLVLVDGTEIAVSPPYRDRLPR